MRAYSTIEFARALGVSVATLHRWRRARRFRVPRLQRLGRISVRLWTEDDLTRVQRYMEKHYRQNQKGVKRREKFDLQELKIKGGDQP